MTQNTAQPMPNNVLVEGGFMVSHVTLWNTTTWGAWQPITGSRLLSGFATTTRAHGQRWGLIGSQQSPLSGVTGEAAVGAWRQGEWDRACELIIRSFPEAASGERSNGTITVVRIPA